MRPLNLIPFGFTPTESLVYQVLLTTGPGTGYAIARAAGLARANAYSALEGLVAKGAARAEGTRPKRYRPEEWCDSARQKDPIERFRIYLEGRGLMDAARNEALHTRCRDLVNQAIQENERVAKPELISLFSDVYKEMPPTLQRVLDEEREARGEGRFP